MNRVLRNVSSMVLMLICSTMAFAQQAELVNLSVEPITIETGETKTISINTQVSDLDFEVEFIV